MFMPLFVLLIQRAVIFETFPSAAVFDIRDGIMEGYQILLSAAAGRTRAAPAGKKRQGG